MQKQWQYDRYLGGRAFVCCLLFIDGNRAARTRAG